MKKTILVISLVAAGTGFAVQAVAENDYPSRSIEFIVPYGPGGGSDNVVRALQPMLEESLGGTLVIRNIAGGGGAVGYNRAVNSSPDGYTVTTPNNANFTLEGLGNVDFSYGDFEYLARILVEPYILAVRADGGWEDIDSLVAFLEAGEKLSVGFSGVGSSTHVTAVSISEELGVDFNFIPFDGGSSAVAAAMGGHVDAVVLNPSEIMSAVDGGRLIPLLSTGEGRSEVFPDTPTLVELGYELELNQWRGIAAPKGVSQEVEDLWVEAVRYAVEDPGFQRFAKEGGSEVSPLFGEELDSFVERTAEVMIPIAESVHE